MGFMKKLIYIDLDDTLADFHAACRDQDSKVKERRMYDLNFFYSLEVMPGAKGAIRELLTMGFDIQILSQPLADCAESYSDKARWVAFHLPHLHDKIVLTQNKGLHLGHYLIDDNEKKWKVPFEKNGGKFVTFHYDKSTWNNDETHKLEWERITDFFRNENPNTEE